MKTERIITVWVIGLLAALGLTLLASGCNRASTATGDLDASGATSTDADASVGYEMSGAELWSNNCNRCHNSRSPAERSDAEWDVIAMHMRMQASLTGEEHRKILEFLKSAN